mmetsp:Transcript_4780/g.19151  ORF Transcript_4780/g.19151 Transcript_4780/m.19151 type:complete len:251 (-) Transcript_4780:802-1554(-)
MDRRSENYERGRLGPGRERARPDVHQRPPQRVPGAAPGHRLSAQRPAPRQLLAAERWPHRDSGLRPDDGNHQGAAERHDQIRVPPFVEAVRQDAGGPHSTWIPGQGAERERGEPQDRRAHHRGGAQPGQQGRRHGGLRSNGPHESRRRRRRAPRAGEEVSAADSSVLCAHLEGLQHAGRAGTAAGPELFHRGRVLSVSVPPPARTSHEGRPPASGGVGDLPLRGRAAAGRGVGGLGASGCSCAALGCGEA